ncbi:TetR/AcrR family transcriptional regulator [Pseudonocardia parietis]|uniref:AcrR family transcriptional regulator n=1 Tax=Pseudonocardia parietis TaxID=570936 RepID=A0ABS4VWF2_9PSEU|nr:TetR family transcriptional regulator [Pseudonocardia parietis]MBP2368048.1 AcrR family transcriptional regulator [Pseudonocardia parietis]
MSAHTRTDRNARTRERILDAAERLFAEHGVHAVSNRAIADAADQGNTAAVGYHFGSKMDLVRTLVRRRAVEVDRRRAEMTARLDGGAGLRDWVACLVRPLVDHMVELGGATWYSRFGAQVMTDPVLREVMVAESLHSRALTTALDGLNACLPALPPDVRARRNEICRVLIVHFLAECETTLPTTSATASRRHWNEAADALIDALVGIATSPVTRGTVAASSGRGA